MDGTDDLDETLLQLVSECLDRVDREGPAAIDDVCALHPQHARRLRGLVGRLRDLGMMERADLTRTLRVLGTSGPDDARVDSEPNPAQGDDQRSGRGNDPDGEAFDGGRVGARARYVLEGEVARGGMGAILRVFDRDLRRHLAMKVALTSGAPLDAPGEVDQKVLARFLEEAQITGQLEHPGIVPVHELGVDARGRLFFTMPLIRGETFKQVIDNVRDPASDWTRTRALGVLQRVCDAVAFAHERGVLHRDLKPGNIMVGRHGETYVMDWGLARVLGGGQGRDIRPRGPEVGDIRTDRADAHAESPNSPLLTFDGDVIGTPAYMPPEQADGNTAELGPPADVYAVGAILYHLLCGHPPFAPTGSDVSAMSLLKRVRRGPPPPIEDEARDVPPELAAICARAMARRPADRYADMSGLSADLRAFMEQRVVRAYASGPWSELKKWTQRNRALSLTAIVAVVAMLLLSGWALLERHTAETNFRTAQNNATLMEAQRDRARDAEHDAREAERDALVQKNAAEVARESERKSAERTRFQAAMVALDLGDREEAARLLAELPSDLGGLDRRYIAQQLDRTLRHHGSLSSPITAIRWSDDGAWMAAGTEDGQVVVFSADQHYGPLSGGSSTDPAAIRALAWNARADRLAAGTASGSLLVFDLTNGPAQSAGVTTLVATGVSLGWVGFNSGDEPLSLGADGALRLHRLPEVLIIARRFGDGSLPALLSPDRTQVWFAPAGTLTSVDTRNGSQQRTFFDRGGDARLIGYDEARHRVISRTDGGVLREFDASTGALLQQGPPTDSADAAAMSIALGRTVLAIRTSAGPALRDPYAAEPRSPLIGHTGKVTAVDFSRGGRLVAAGSDDGSISVWDTDTTVTPDLGFDFDHIDAVAFDALGARIACAISFDGVETHPIVLIDGATGAVVRSAAVHSKPVAVLAFDPDGRRIASASTDGVIWICDAADATRDVRFSCDLRADSLAFARGDNDNDNDQLELLVGCRGRPIQRYRVANGARRPDVTQQGPIAATGLGPLLAVQGSAVVMLDPATRQTTARFQGPDDPPIAVAIHQGGAWIAASFPDRSIHVWSTDGGHHRRILSDQPIERLQFTRDPTRLSCARDGRVMVADLDDGVASLVWNSLLGEDRESDHLQFSPDGRSAFYSGRTRPRLLHADRQAAFEFLSARGREHLAEQWIFEQLQTSGDPRAVRDELHMLRPDLQEAALARLEKVDDPLTAAWSQVAWNAVEPDLARPARQLALRHGSRAAREEPTNVHHRRLRAWALLMNRDLAAARTEADLAARLARAESLDAEPAAALPLPVADRFSDAIRAIADAIETAAAGGDESPLDSEEPIARWLQDKGLGDALAAVRDENLAALRREDPAAETLFARFERLIARAHESTWKWVPAPSTGADPTNHVDLYPAPTSAEQQAFSAALRDAEEAMELVPWTAAGLHTLGLAQYRIGQVDLALGSFRRADQENQRSSNPYPRIRDLAFQAMCYWRIGRNEDSLREFRARIAELEPAPADEESVAALEELDRITSPSVVVPARLQDGADPGDDLRVPDGDDPGSR